MAVPITGRVDPAVEAVRTAFHDLLSSGRETGAALAVIHNGRLVVDLCGGWRDAGRTEPWQPDTLVCPFSVSKPFAASCLVQLADRGRVGLDDPISRYWPEFSAAAVTVRQVLAHTAGLPVFPIARGANAIADWDLLAGDLAEADAHWTPGSVAAEHALTYGHLVGELVRRLSGRTLGRFLAEELAGPWRLDIGFGLSEVDQRRCAELEHDRADWPSLTLGEPGSLRHAALGNPAGCLELGVLNSPLWRGSLLPAVNMHATAVGVARWYAGMLAGGILNDVRLLSADTVAEVIRTQYEGPDLLLGGHVRWTLGMQQDDDGSWGMGGIGGSTGYADPGRGYSLAYLTRRLGDFSRVDLIVEALHSSLDA